MFYVTSLEIMAMNTEFADDAENKRTNIEQCSET